MSKRVLVIDDELGYRELYQYVLGPLGYQVESAENGQQGYEMAIKTSYDLILLDAHLPKMTGSEVLQRIKQARPDQRVIVFTSSSDPARQFEDQAKDAGAFDCLYKPVDLELLLGTIRRAMNDI